jgi:hypothetical protein
LAMQAVATVRRAFTSGKEVSLHPWDAETCLVPQPP